MTHQTQLPITPDARASVSRKQVTIYTDGGCEPNPGFGGWAAVLRYGAAYREICGCEANTTNNRMEMRAVLEALNLLKEPCDVIMRSDSQHVVVSFLNREGKKPHKRANQDLVQLILAAMARHVVRAEWIRGHNGDADNERCDQLCAQMIRRSQQSGDPFSG